jgi:hypothetical protein
MNIKLKVWWKELDAKEQSGIIVFGSIIAGIAILLSGIKVGQVIGIIINMQ